jgi:hypothetical protein
MNRRDYLKVLAVAVPVAGLSEASAEGAPSAHQASFSYHTRHHGEGIENQQLR